MINNPKDKIEGFDTLAELALNLRWSWNHATDEVWQQLDPKLWEITNNPWVVLQTTSNEKIKHVLTDPEFRKKLIEGGEEAVAASDDPMIVLERRLDPLRREAIKWSQDNVESVEERAGEQLGKARFAAFGRSDYPDATFTLRLSYGQVAGYPMNGTKAPAKTTLFGLYDRAYGFGLDGPFALPARYLEGREKLDLTTPFDFVTTNDIIGGNSGSPILNSKAELIGLIFDGNIDSLGGDYGYDGAVNRAVGVSAVGLRYALATIYHADRIAKELQGAK